MMEGEQKGEEGSKAIDLSNIISIGVTGFDELVNGGIPKGISVIVVGGPGSGKTTFCLQTLYEGALKGEKCLYLSFEESEDRLRAHMKAFGWDIDRLEAKGFLSIRRMDPFEISRSIEALLAKARGELLIELDEVTEFVPKGFEPDRIVFDSLSAISAAFAGKEEGYRIYIEQLFKVLEKIGSNSFLILENEQSLTRVGRTGVEEFLADGVVAFYNIRHGNLRVGAVEVVKIRGRPIAKKIVPMRIVTDKGMEIYPQEELFS